MLCFLSIVSRQEKGGPKASGKTRNATAGKGDRQTSFHRSKLLNILGHVTSKYGLELADYITSDEKAYYWLCGPSPVWSIQWSSHLAKEVVLTVINT